MKTRIKRLQISPEVLAHMFEQNNAWRVYQGIPPGAIMRGVFIDPHTQVIHMYIEHATFEEVELYAVFPELEMEFLKIK